MIWKNTKTLDKYLDNILITNKENAKIAIIGSKPLKFDEFPLLKAIFRVGIGSDNIDFNEAKKRDIEIVFPSEKTINYIYEETANYTCSLILNAAYNNVGDVNSWIKKDRKFLGNKNLLIIGAGNIGYRVLNKMSKFMHIDTFDIIKNNQQQLKEKIKAADIITLHIPLTEKNINFFNKEKLSWMKDDGVLINTSRGKIVSEDDLQEELLKNRIYAYFDVFWNEPYNGKLVKIPNFYMSPHIASTCNEFLESAFQDLKKILRKYNV